MKTLIVVLISIIILTTLFLYIFQRTGSPNNPIAVLNSQSQNTPVQSLVPSVSPTPIPAIPQKITIPSLAVEAPVEPVGLDNENKMDVPKNVMGVAWYNLGVKPGQNGNAVMAGHLDKKDGSPAVFFNLTKLKPGDSITINDSEGNEYEYTVTETASYPVAQFPLREVFGETTRARLNLITCEGVFNRSSNLYSHRYVVYSELKR